MKREEYRSTIQIQKRNKLLGLSALLILGILAWMVYYDFSSLLELEKNVNQLFQNFFGNPSMTYSANIGNSIMTFLADYGGAKPLSIATLVVAAFLLVKKETFLSIWFVGVVSTGGILGILLKNIFQRTRPFNHLALDDGFSFPSGHAIVSTLFFLTLILFFLPRIQDYFWRMTLISGSYILWFGILFSRLYFHAHHLADILAGVSYGIFWVTSAISVYYFLINYRTQYFNRKNQK